MVIAKSRVYHFIILERLKRDAKDRPYIIHNTRMEFDKGHTHVMKKHECLDIIENVVTGHIPLKKEGKMGVDKFQDYLLSHIRISDDEQYNNKIYNILKDKNRCFINTYKKGVKE